MSEHHLTFAHASLAETMTAGPAHAPLINQLAKFVFGGAAVGGVIWKMGNLSGGDAHDHEALERTKDAKDAEKCARRSTEKSLRPSMFSSPKKTLPPDSAACSRSRRLLRRHSSQTNFHSKEKGLHPEAQALK